MSPLPFWQQCVIIALCSLASMLSRSLPFLLFKPGASLPSYIRYLGKALPSAALRTPRRVLPEGCFFAVRKSWYPGSHRPPCDHAAPPLETADDALHGRRHDPLHGTCAVCVSLKGTETPSWASPMYLGVSLLPCHAKSASILSNRGAFTLVTGMGFEPILSALRTQRLNRLTNRPCANNYTRHR